MTKSVFICGMDHEAGSSVVTLGLCGCLRNLVDGIAFFKPVGGGPSDLDVGVMTQAFRLVEDPADMCPLTIEEARELVARQREGELLERIQRAYDRLCRDNQFIIIEGINNQRSVSVFDMDINERIAAHLHARVVLVARGSANGGSTDVAQLADSVLTTKRDFESKEIEILGAVVNRVRDKPLADVSQKVTEAFEAAGIRSFGVLPNLSFLGYPKLDRIAEEIGAEVLVDQDGLATAATKTIVAAMEPRHFLKHLNTDRTLVIMPGDREDVLLCIACAQKSPMRRSLSGVILTGGLRPDQGVLDLIHDMGLPSLPIMAVPDDTFTTATRIGNVDTRMRPQDRDKINTAISSVATHVKHEKLWEALEMPRPKKRRTGSDAFLDEIICRAQAADKRIVLPEGNEPRTIRALGKIQEMGICSVTLLGQKDEIRSAAKEAGVVLGDRVQIVQPADAPELDRYAETVVEVRKGKRGGMTADVAKQWLLESTIHYGTLMVKCGDADGLVSGAIHSTGDTIRPALQIIRVKPEVGVVSSVFFMALPDRVLVYGDCAIIPDPNASELAAIAIASARTARAFGIEPRVAMLSYSTGKSGAGESVDKVTEATALVRERNPDFAIDGPLQYDAAIDPDVGKLKQPDSPVAGQANVFIFPDLDAGNIAYKAVQRSAGALAVGPVLQGLNMPVNDLSRGCSVEDIVYTVAVTAVQAAS